ERKAVARDRPVSHALPRLQASHRSDADGPPAGRASAHHDAAGRPLRVRGHRLPQVGSAMHQPQQRRPSMNRDDLLKMLDLAGKEAGPKEGALDVTPAESGTSKPLASPTALKVDAWGMRKGEELLESSPRLSAHESLTREAVADFHTAAF